MSAIELIEQLKALSPHEQADFARRFRELQADASTAREEQNGQAGCVCQWPDFSGRLRRIYGDKIAPDSQAVIE
jgi:hypothetical protein